MSDEIPEPPPGRFDEEEPDSLPENVIGIKTRKRSRGAPKQAVELKPGQHAFDMGDHVEIGACLNRDLAAVAPTTFTEGAFYRYAEQVGCYGEVPHNELSCIIQGYSGSPVESSGKRLGVRLTDIKSGIVCAANKSEVRDFFRGAKDGITFASTFVAVTKDSIQQEPHALEQRSRFAYGFGYQPTAEPKRFLDFLRSSFDGDEDAELKIALLQEHVGLGLIGQGCRYQKAVMMVGSKGANGKSTAQAILAAAMPPGSVISIAPHDMGSDYERARFPGARLNIVSEVEQRELVHSEPWKAIIDGKNEIKARSPYKDVFFFRPIAAHLYSCNRPPDTADQSGGFWRRWAVVQFNRSFEPHEQVADLDKQVIASELPAVVSWLLRGAQRALEQGRYTSPPSSEAAITLWRQSADQVAEFMAAQCLKLQSTTPNHNWTPAAQLYKAYQNWATLNGHRFPLTQRRFAERMEYLQCGSKRSGSANLYPVELHYGDNVEP